MKCSSALMILGVLLMNSCNSTISLESSKEKSLVDLVNPLMGTDSNYSLSNGNTYPAIATPWAMNFWTPMTAKMGDGWTYTYDGTKIRGIKQTHQPSPWINDYAAFSIMPVTGNLTYQEDERASWFSHQSEQAKPYLYQVYLADYDVELSIAPTDRAAHFEITFPENDQSYIVLDAFFKGSMVKIIPEERKIIGYCKNNSGGVPTNFKNYFVATFDKDFELNHTWGDGWNFQENTLNSEGDHVGAIIGFKTQKDEKVHIKVASSFISLAQAELNLSREVGNDTFEQTTQKAKDLWETELSKIKVKDSNSKNVETFYSSLYRVLLFPRKFYEIDSQNNIVHYSPYNGEVLEGYMFTDNGFWDTFRAVFPFFNLMYPEQTKQMMEGLVNAYKESGWLPEWASPGHRDCMIGSNSAVVVGEAFSKGNVNEADQSILLEALLKNATVEENRPENSVGRMGLSYYNTLGYVPYDVGINENAARTLEYAFADFHIGTIAHQQGKDGLAKTYFDQSMNYRNLYDPQTKWMRGKNEDGNFQSPFNPLKWGDAFTEGNSVHYTWSVFHDVQGLINLMGGDENFIQRLDEVFEMPPLFDASYYGHVIHEIREMQIAHMGNYAHGNQPIQHMIYLYNYAGVPYKAQRRIREVLTRLYSATPDGYCGDEDNGQTSAWYVFSAMGFYPVTPGINQYVIGSPLFESVQLNLPNQKQFVIRSKNNDQSHFFINSVQLNGEDYQRPYIDYQTLSNGGQLLFNMSDHPNTNWGTSVENRPYSLSNYYETNK